MKKRIRRLLCLLLVFCCFSLLPPRALAAEPVIHLTRGTQVVLPGAPYDREGWLFLGWAKAPNAGTPDYRPGQSLTAEGEVTLYPVWLDLSESDCVLPSGLRVLEDEALSGLPLRYVRLPESLTALGSRVFAGCTELKAVYIPASLTRIAADAFDGAPTDLILVRESQPQHSYTGITTWPAPTSNRGLITSRYGESRPGHFHAGIDIDGYGCDGAAIVAAGSGTVIFSGSSGGYGNYVMIDHGGGYVTLYAHMSGNAVSKGQWVNAGQTVGYMGATGNASGTHLHFEIRVNGSTVDPEGWFPGHEHWNC